MFYSPLEKKILQIKVPHAWKRESAGRLILRLKNSDTNTSVSKSLRFGHRVRVSISELPEGDIDKTVFWVDLVDGNKATPLTSRVKFQTLRNIQKLPRAIYSKGSGKAATEPSHSMLIASINACRWASTKETRAQLPRISRGILNRISEIDNSAHSPLSKIIREISEYDTANDGTDVLDQIFFVHYLSTLRGIRSRADNPETDGIIDEISRFDSFTSMNILSGLLKESFSNDKLRNGFRRSPNLERIKSLEIKQDILSGLYTYGNPSEAKFDLPPFEIIEELVGTITNVPTVIYSANPKYLMAYAPRLAFYMSVMTNMRYHLHIIGTREEASIAAREFLDFLQATFTMRSVDIRDISIEVSWSNCPVEISQPVAYYASARYIIASEVMNRHNSSVWIQDVDLFPTGDIRKNIEQLNKNDVTLFKSRFLEGLLPWVKHLAGCVYIRNNPNGKYFLSKTTEYLQSFLISEKNWMIDQNALSFAIEESDESFSLGSMSALKVPVTQSKLAAIIETQGH